MSDVPCRRTRTATSDQNSFVSTPRLRWSRAVLCIIVALLTATRLSAVILKISTWALRSHAQDNGRPNGFDWHEVCRGREKRAGGAHEETEKFVVSASSKIYHDISADFRGWYWDSQRTFFVHYILFCILTMQCSRKAPKNIFWILFGPRQSVPQA